VSDPDARDLVRKLGDRCSKDKHPFFARVGGGTPPQACQADGQSRSSFERREDLSFEQRTGGFKLIEVRETHLVVAKRLHPESPLPGFRIEKRHGQRRLPRTVTVFRLL
jgi:hypothetical protein